MNKMRLALKSITIPALIITLLIVSTYKLHAQGPNAPEAASFEPIDATDMVNLVTGDFTYVLPILNVPSPEGGYPLALAYHAGIAMDQEASWTGLGWNLNAGAINRSINQYPDDYNNSLLAEYFYDQGSTDYIYSLSTSYSNGLFSAGMGFSWGSNRSLGGYVSVGYGFNIDGVGNLGGSVSAGTDGVGINLGLTTKIGLSVGVSASSNGGLGGSIGFDNNGTGFSVSSNGSINISIAQSTGKDNMVSLGLTLSSNGIGFNAGVTNKTGNKVDGGAGAGLHLQFENTVSMGDYTTKSSGWNIPIVVPTQVGVFSLSFGKQEFRYYLGRNEYSHVNGPIHFNERLVNATRWQINCSGSECYYAFQSSDWDEVMEYISLYQGDAGCNCSAYVLDPIDAFMDVYEVPLDGNDLSNTSQINLSDNAIFPSYDKYNVQAQGLSGGMSSRLFENGNLFGHPNRESQSQFEIDYFYGSISAGQPNDLRFNSKPYFYFDNEISSYLAVNEASFNSDSSNNVPYQYSNGVDPLAELRQRKSTYIAYFLNEEIKENYASVKAKGYLIPQGSGFDINSINIPDKGIGAFKITAVDGKTYHYSLPVYNHEIVTRTFGIITERPYENQAYFEKRQLEPYATHWLLTTVTGPDYFDTNNNGYADKGDYGYWTTFEYGKWSDAYVWKAPYGEDYFESENNNNKKTWIKGRKQIYYLDRVKTRTHTALFIKSSRNDALSTQWNYQSVAHVDDIDQASNPFQSRFNIPSQEPLKLDKIILVKEVDDTLDKSYGASYQNYTDVHYNDSSKPSEQSWYNLKDNVLDIGDNINSIIPKALKVIDFHYDNSLAIGSPNSNIPSQYGRLTLNSVHFKGKGGEELIPSYDFSYNNDTSYYFNIDDKDAFGYYKYDNSMWSLNEITTPIGGKIQVNYETHSFDPVLNSEINFSILNQNYNVDIISSYNNNECDDLLIFNISSDHDLGIEIGDQLNTTFSKFIVENDLYIYGFFYEGNSTVVQSLGDNTFRVQSNGSVTCTYQQDEDAFLFSGIPTIFNAIYQINNVIYDFGGVRVASLVTTDGNNSYTTNYNYGENENGIGHISYLPYAPQLEKELPYSSELPPPKVMYEFVTLESFGTNNQSEGKIQYKFKVLNEKDENAIKFGDLYEIETITNSGHYNATADKDVEVRSYNIKDNLATLGQLLEVSMINNEGHILSKIENTYYTPDEMPPNSVGITKESYQSYKVVDYINNTSTLKDKWLINSSSRVKYPSLLKYSTEYKGGYMYTSQFGELDEITGQANEILSIASDGTEVKFKVIPAYHKYIGLPFFGDGMGSKVGGITNKNMLSQNTAHYSYIKDPSGIWKEISVSISTWNNNWNYRDSSGTETTETNIDAKVWRRHKEYIWKGELNSDGSYKDYIDNFDWNSDIQSPEWKEVSEVTKYTRFSTPLEFKDINNNRATTKMCDEDSKVLVTGNAWYGEMYYSGAEYKEGGIYLDNEIVGASYQTSEQAHTGSYSIKLNPGDEFGAVLRANEHRDGYYKISAWVHKDNYMNARIKAGSSGVLTQFNGEKIIAGDWVLLNHRYKRGASAITSSTLIMVASAQGIIYVDDFRIHPNSSSMISYVYNQWDELEYILGANNLATKFEYDSQGRLITTYSEIIDAPDVIGGFKKTSENFYNYKNQ